MRVLLLRRVEIIVEKGEIAHFEQFLLLPQCFQKFSMLQNASTSGKGLRAKSTKPSY